MKNLSKHFSYKEFTYSATAVMKEIDNTPTEEHLQNGILLCENVLEKIREKFGPVKITSFYRGFRLNKAIGGSSKTSQHLTGQAADFVVPGESLRVVMDWIVKESGILFDQCLYEDLQKDGSAIWIHISYDKKRARREALTMKRINGNPTYIPYK